MTLAAYLPDGKFAATGSTRAEAISAANNVAGPVKGLVTVVDVGESDPAATLDAALHAGGLIVVR